MGGFPPMCFRVKKKSRNVDTQQKITGQSITSDIVSLVTTIHTKMSRLSPYLLVFLRGVPANYSQVVIIGC